MTPSNAASSAEPVSPTEWAWTQCDRFRGLQARLTNRLFLHRLKLRLRLFPVRKMSILFSNKEDWRPSIELGFRGTPHVVEFADLQSRSLADYDLVVPLTIPDLKYLNEVRPQIAHNPLPIPSLDSVLLCDDKLLLNRALAERGFAEYVPQIGGSLKFPYILKKRVDAWGANSYLIGDVQQEQHFASLRADPEYFTQEFVPGSCEYATHILYRDGRIVCSLNMKYEFASATPIKGRSPEEYRGVCRCPYLKLFAAMLQSIGFEGLCCFNYKVRARRPLLLEINPRFGGSLCTYFFSFVEHLI